jgi:hypothetical protein
MRFVIPILSLFLVNLAYAETTFVDQDDAFIMHNPTTRGTTEGTTEGLIEGTIEGTGGGGCITKWVCDDWSQCINGEQKRVCAKESSVCYASEKDRPSETQSCIYTAPAPSPEEVIPSQESALPSVQAADTQSASTLKDPVIIPLNVGILTIAALTIIILIIIIDLKRKKI